MAHIRTWLLAAGLAMAGMATAPAAAPETPRLRMIGVQDGLPSANVNALAFDRAGHLWIATTDGLARYDGIGMRVWRHEPDDPTSLPGNFVAALHVDAQDRVWAAIEGAGLSVLDATRTDFRHFRRASHPAIGSDDTWAIASQRGALWFGTFGGGLHRLEADGRLSRYMPVPGDARSLPSETVLALAVDARGRLWVGTTAGLAYWTGRDFERVALPGANPAAMVYSIAVEDRAVWVGTRDGLYRLDDGDRWHSPAWTAMFGLPNAVLDLVPDGGGRYWLASQRNLWRVEPGQVPFPVPVGAQGPVRPIFQLLRQRDGALWVPVPGAGLGYLRPDWRRLSEYRRSDGGLASELYTALAPSAEGGVWLGGHRGGIERLDAAGDVHRLPLRARRVLEGRRLGALLEADDGALWIGERHALLRLGRDGAMQVWPAGDAPDAPLAGPILLFAQAPDRSVWVSYAGAGLQQRDARSGRVISTVPSGDTHGLGAGDLEAMAFDDAGRLWIAGEDGLSVWNTRTGRFVPVPGVARGARVFAFAFEPGGLWLQRLGGLERYRADGAHWHLVERIGPESGVPAVEGSGLTVDHDGRVWLASRRGLFRWDPRQRRLRHFGIGDGLSSQEFNDRGLVLDRDGRLHATLADGGVVRLDTRAPDPAPQRAALRFDRVDAWRAGRWQALDRASPVLAPGDRELRVQLRLLAFDHPRANRYFTRLAGHDVDWVAHSGSDPGERVFAGLPPGAYTLHARAIDAAGNPAVERRLRFEVRAPWWRTPWAAGTLALFAALLAVIAVVAWRARRARRLAWQRAEHEREVARDASLAKTRFLATLGHEVRTPMTGVLGMSELLLETPLTPRQREYADAIRGAGEHLLRLVNDALDLARIEAGRLELADEPFDLHELVRAVAGLMGPLARRRGLQFACDVGAAVPHGVRGDAVRVRQILLNLLGNAVKFTEHGQVALRVEALPGLLRFSISDTGPGLGAQQRERLFRRFEQGFEARSAARYGGSGLGLAICQELAAAMGGCIDVASEPGRGTRFDVDLPLAPAPLPRITAAETVVVLPCLRVLLVEDDATVAEVVAGLLESQGHAVTRAGHGLAALAAFATATFDIALLDLDLPGMDGLALARHLRGLGFDLPLVALTARADAGAESASIDAGFDRFMRKPVTGAMLSALLGECCRSEATSNAREAIGDGC